MEENIQFATKKNSLAIIDPPHVFDSIICLNFLPSANIVSQERVDSVQY